MNKAFKSSLIISQVAFAVSALSVFMIAFISTETEPAKNPVSIVIALAFWIGLVVGIVSSVAAARMRGKIEKRVAKGRSLGLPGIISFRRDVLSLVLYSVFVVGAVLIIIDLIFNSINEYVMYASVSLTYLAFTMHCVADGKNYKIYKLLKKGDKYGNK